MLSGLKYNNLINNYTLDVGGVLTKFDSLLDACQYSTLDRGVFKMRVAGAEKFEWFEKLKSGLIAKAKKVDYSGSGFKVFTLAKYSSDHIRLVEYNVPAIIQYMAVGRFSVQEKDGFIAVYVPSDRYNEAVNSLPIWLYNFDLACIGIGDGGDLTDCLFDLDHYPDYPVLEKGYSDLIIEYRLFKPKFNYRPRCETDYSQVIDYMTHRKVPCHLRPICNIVGDYLDISFPESQKANFDRLVHLWMTRFGLEMQNHNGQNGWW